MIDLSAQTEEEMEAIRKAVVEKEGLLLSVFDVLRRVPRRVLMVLKLNDLTRSLDRALMTTHSNVSPPWTAGGVPGLTSCTDQDLLDHGEVLHLRGLA